MIDPVGEVILREILPLGTNADPLLHVFLAPSRLLARRTPLHAQLMQGTTDSRRVNISHPCLAHDLVQVHFVLAGSLLDEVLAGFVDATDSQRPKLAPDRAFLGALPSASLHGLLSEL